MDFSSSGVIRGRSIICRDWDPLSFPLLTDPLCTVRLPRDLLITWAVSLLGAKPPKMVTWVLSTMISAPSLP